MHLVQRFETPDQAEAGVAELLAKHEKIMGFGHRVYRTNDPRSNVVKKLAGGAAVTWPVAVGPPGIT